MKRTTVYTATAAKNRFGEVMDRLNSEPVEISRNSRIIAVMLSKRDFEALTQRIEDLQTQIKEISDEKVLGELVERKL